MTDTSTVKAEADKAEAKVPIEALAEARAKTRAAKADAEALKEELAKTKEHPQIDLDGLEPILERLAAESRKLVDAEMAPIKAEAAKLKMAMAMGLSEAQADKIVEIGAKNPNLTDPQKLLLARSEFPDVFPQSSQPSWNRAVYGGAPVTGNSESRGGQPEDFTAKMHEAEKNKDYAGAEHFATQEILRRYTNAYERQRPR